MRRSGLLVHLVNRLRGNRGISRFEELDCVFDEILRQHPSVNDLDGLDLARLEALNFKPPNLELPGDPFSRAYHDRIWEFFRSLRGGSSYSSEGEGNNYEFDRDRDRFFPYHTQSASRVGQVLTSIGVAIRGMDLTPGSRIVELGAGSGNLTYHLSLMGYRVTSVEVGKGHAELIRHRCNLPSQNVEVVNQDMLEFAESNTQRFDAALFSASLHHCSQHFAMLEKLSAFIEKDGLICLVDEPIYPSKCPQLPYAWGPMLGGLALLTIRKLGWLELGFQYGYLKQAFSRLGWNLRRMGTTFYAENVCIARRAS